jgi:hypothetical protein
VTVRRWIGDHRVLAALLAAVTITALSAALVSGRAARQARPSTVSPSPQTTHGIQADATRYTPATLDPPATATQTAVDHRLAQAESPASIAALETLEVPAGQDSAAYPAIPTADRRDPTTYARAFVTELLNRTYGEQTRSELLAWAQAESSFNTLPGVPTSVQAKALYASLASPALAGGSGATPVPSALSWESAARTATTQRVSGMVTTVDRSWTELVGQGWEPRDPLMTMIDVRLTLTITSNGVSISRTASLVVALGSCNATPGLGAVAVQDWLVR